LRKQPDLLGRKTSRMTRTKNASQEKKTTSQEVGSSHKEAQDTEIKKMGLKINDTIREAF
jgi:hypothetical protein